MSYRSELIQVAAVAVAAVQDFDTGSTVLDEQEHRGYEEMEAILNEVREERNFQMAKWGEQTHTPDRWGTILMEEVGEVAEANLEGDF